MIKEKRILLKHAGNINPESIKEYLDAGGYKALHIALSGKPEKVVEEVMNSGRRGRGGAGFPTGIKKQAASSRRTETNSYMVCNADEGEPGTFKDRAIMENNPHLLIEGMIIAAYSIGAEKGYIYIRGEYYDSIRKLQNAINQAYDSGYLGMTFLRADFHLIWSLSRSRIIPVRRRAHSSESIEGKGAIRG
jgi:NADH-quinone oxidoreductase subunit F